MYLKYNFDFTLWGLTVHDCYSDKIVNFYWLIVSLLRVIDFFRDLWPVVINYRLFSVDVLKLHEGGSFY